MAKSIQSISSDINELIRKNGNEGITLKWDQFYAICGRDRIADVIMEKISSHLKKYDLYIVYGHSHVIIVRDFCWNPVTL
jgi:hypothetical protein